MIKDQARINLGRDVHYVTTTYINMN